MASLRIADPPALAEIDSGLIGSHVSGEGSGGFRVDRLLVSTFFAQCCLGANLACFRRNSGDADIELHVPSAAV